MKPKYIRLPTESESRLYFINAGLVFISYPDYLEERNQNGANCYLKVTFDTWYEHLLKGIYTIQEIAEYEPIIQFYETLSGLKERIIKS